jgi:ribosomal protein S18 acetylase RimI-like enzyme
VLRHVFRLARGLGRTRVVLLGGTQATNARAIHYYRKHGFEDCGGFEAPAGVWNIDMAADLGAAGEA